MNKINCFFNPKSVAVIGASRDQKKIGHIVFRNFVEGRFKGKVFPVNPKTKKLLGRKCYTNVTQIKEKIDLAVISIPAEFAPKALEECGKKRIPAVVIVSGGFKEVGEDELEDRLKKIAKRYGIRIIGPNCLGIFDPSTGVDMIFLPRYKLERPKEGGISFITQSGAVGSVVLDWMARKGYKISKFVSYGNAVDVDEADLMEHLAEDKKTKVICAYFEGVREGRKFLNVTKKISGVKPIIILKGGTTEAGNKAISSHTGSLAGSFEVYTAAFKQAGVLQADDMEELFGFARTLSTLSRPKGNRVQIITDGGGFGVLLSDNIVENGLTLAKMKKETTERLRKKMPSYVVLKNPIDLTGDADVERYREALDAALADPNVDMIGLIVLLQVPRLGGDIVQTITNAFKSSEKPIFVISAGGEYTEVLKKSLEDFGIPTFSYTQNAAKAMRVLYEFSEEAEEYEKRKRR
ncbi:MAG: CoA-binding protein [Candidatus Aenigmarchaeota archaeon]|nr:CoA-binding protein [Candidatus Aenigmarchaeota archaeon]NIP39956.1 CoA-binding protein [Candidatus Aenigmarchaeota archaeon]NIQ17675.1 CoA-binding protein [Candidatus Aenigmarchaeota archaeon]NIS72863.1 CoA-binding protein [Candidatus Aenigmarchaeota archaeon]